MGRKKSKCLPVVHGRFELSQLVPRSGKQAKTYLGKDILLERSVIIKKLEWESVQKEAQILARCDSHPNVVRVHDALKADDEGYLVLEVAPGFDLYAFLEHSTFTKRQAVRIVLAILETISHVHQCGVLHLDIQPGNIFLQGGDASTLKLIDFGTAEWLDVNGQWAGTARGGSNEYMAAEQWQEPGVMFRSTDLYAIAGVLVFLLTKKDPFSEHSLKDHQGNRRSWGIDPALESVIAKAMAPTPEDRYQFAEDLMRALSPFS